MHFGLKGLYVQDFEYDNVAAYMMRSCCPPVRVYCSSRVSSSFVLLESARSQAIKGFDQRAAKRISCSAVYSLTLLLERTIFCIIIGGHDELHQSSLLDKRHSIILEDLLFCSSSRFELSIFI